MFTFGFSSLLLSLIALIISGRSLIKWLTKFTRAFGIPEFSVGFVLLAVSTSLPEIFVAISSARQQAASLVLATALGSNIVNMTFIVGMAAIVSIKIATSGINMRRDLILGGVITILPLVFMTGGSISRLEGLLLIAAFCVYVRQIYRDRKSTHPGNGQPRHYRQGLAALVVISLLVAILLISAEVTVQSATAIAQNLGLPSFLIGLFVLAFGTSLPELITTLSAALQRRPGLALGNILGSNVADSGLVIGLAALTHPLITPLTAEILVTAVFVLLSLFTLGWFARTRRSLSLAEGLGLLFLFMLFGWLLFIVTAPAIFI